MLHLLHVCCSDCLWLFFFFKQKTAYEMRISDWSSDVCSSDLLTVARRGASPVSALPAEHGDGTATVRPGSDPVPIVRAVDKPTAVRVENAPSSAAESGSIRVSIDKEIGRAHV